MSTIRKSFKFRLYPTVSQGYKLNRTLTICRHTYNDALDERIWNAKTIKDIDEADCWGLVGGIEGRDYVSRFDQQVTLKENKSEYQKEVYSQVLQDVLKRVDRSFINFYNGSGYPRFQGANRYDSFTYSQSGFKILDNGKLQLSKIGDIKIVQHREIEGEIKTLTIKRDVDYWYATFSCELDVEPKPKTGKSIGIDVGLSSIITTSDGDKVKPPKHLRKLENKLTTAQRRLSRKKKCSNNRNKQRIEVAKLHRKIRNQRQDFNHKLSRQLVDDNDIIVFEDLQIKNMVKNHHLAKSILDAGWYQLMTMTKYKAEYAGKEVILVDPKNTTQACSMCLSIVPKTLSDRVHNCPECGIVLDRDHNAAINILHVGQGLAELTLLKLDAIAPT